MQFRPCIDIHNGKVKQLVGSSLSDDKQGAKENFVAEADSVFYANLYKEKNLKGGHVILLNPPGDLFFEETKKQALEALKAYPQGLQVGGGITCENAEAYLRAGASHVIVTSYVFRDGILDFERLDKLKAEIGQERIVLDLSCKKYGNAYYIMTNRWQKKTDLKLDVHTLHRLRCYCDEFLVHAVDVEGKMGGIEEDLVRLLGSWGEIPVTYAGGVHEFEDLEKIRAYGQGRVHVTIGSALDLFGGRLKFEEVIARC